MKYYIIMNLYLLDFRVEPEESVYPMIAAGKGLHEMVGVKPND